MRAQATAAKPWVDGRGRRSSCEDSERAPVEPGRDIAMIGLPERLGKLEGLCHTLYDDELALWVDRGVNDGQIEDTLQRAIWETETYLRPIVLKCSPEK
ncbi:hypothetical protein HPB49_001188 [Dermacentor silvarum]|uniref:Uncharacterized protein n=1 Tax=Dermacentor silvarum TaxID=543639 RepID=A0ACB8DHN8_DERSI|nr:hypothetical protein HPB49_001188 [Dermacentor silvarum]